MERQEVCPKCDSIGCGSVVRRVQFEQSSNGFFNLQGDWVNNPHSWTVTQLIVESESITCLRRQIELLGRANHELIAKLAEAARLAKDTQTAAKDLSQ